MSKTKTKLQEMVEIINDVLETTWTDNEMKEGKEIDVPPGWRGLVTFIIKEYEKVGWRVNRRVEILSSSPRAPRDYLSFIPPSLDIRQPKF